MASKNDLLNVLSTKRLVEKTKKFIRLSKFFYWLYNNFAILPNIYIYFFQSTRYILCSQYWTLENYDKKMIANYKI